MLRKARISDISLIHRLINSCAERGEMLPRSLAELYDNMRDYFVYEHPETGEVGGACSLHICWEDLAEIRSLCVVDHLRRLGVGADLVRACMEEATQLVIEKLFVLTYRREFFRRFGFTEVEKTKLPQKIWTDCVKCPKFPLCDEVAMITRLATRERGCGIAH
jgi:amino-acid N-acetyltransferase